MFNNKCSSFIRTLRRLAFQMLLRKQRESLSKPARSASQYGQY